jgi:hypothetical protein
VSEKFVYGISFHFVLHCCHEWNRHMLQFCRLILVYPLFIVYILNKGERSYNFFPPGWIISFASEERAVGLNVASILDTMVTVLLLFLVSYPQTALLLLVRDYGTA